MRKKGIHIFNSGFKMKFNNGYEVSCIVKSNHNKTNNEVAIFNNRGYNITSKVYKELFNEELNSSVIEDTTTDQLAIIFNHVSNL